MQKNNKSVILIISNEPWGDMWYSKHIYAYELSKTNKVFFINPCYKWSFKNLLSFNVSADKISENLFSVNYKNNLPVILWKRAAVFLNDFLNSIKLKKALNPIGDTVFWQFDPVRFCDVFFFRNIKRIYHISDPFKHFPFNKRIASKVDLIVCTSINFVDYYKTMNTSVIYIPHGISQEEFNLSAEKCESIKSKYGKFIFTAASISDRINFDLLKELSHHFKNINFVFAGQIMIAKRSLEYEKFLQLVALPNFHHIGVIRWQELKNYISSSAICIAPYNFILPSSISGVITSSLKILSYMVQKKIIITSVPIEIELRESKGIFYAKNNSEFISLLEKALSNFLFINEKESNDYINKIKYENLISEIFQNIH